MLFLVTPQRLAVGLVGLAIFRHVFGVVDAVLGPPGYGCRGWSISSS